MAQNPSITPTFFLFFSFGVFVSLVGWLVVFLVLVFWGLFFCCCGVFCVEGGEQGRSSSY